MSEESENNRNSIILMALLAFNMFAISAFGYFLWQQKKSATPIQAADKSVNGKDKKNENPSEAPLEENSFTHKIVRFESLIANLSGDNGRREVQLSFEARCEGERVLAELESLRPKIRDAIISVVTSSVAEDLVTTEGKQKLKDDIKNQINSLLSKGKITEVYLTSLQLN